MITQKHLIQFAAVFLLLVVCIGNTYATPIPWIKHEGKFLTFIKNNPVIKRNLKLIKKIGEEVGNPETLQAMSLQETMGGTNLNNHKSHGIMQVQVVAARSVFKKSPTLLHRYFPKRKNISNGDIIRLLRTNNEANIRIAAHHFKNYSELSKNWSTAVAAYNVGIGGVKNVRDPVHHEYVEKVRYWLIKYVRPFNSSNI